MGINEKMDRLSELLREVNKLADEIEAECVKEKPIVKDDEIADYLTSVQEDEQLLYFINSDGLIEDNVDESGAYTIDDFDGSKYRYYLSLDFAEQALKLKRFNDILLAFKWCYDKGFEYNCNSNKPVYSIWYDSVCETYLPKRNSYPKIVTGLVYFSSEDIAEKCCLWLNRIDPKGEMAR